VVKVDLRIPKVYLLHPHASDLGPCPLVLSL
jgi:hypothetical protein